MNCDNCGKESEGRFCSKACARSFSTKGKREAINQKVSETLKKKYADSEPRKRTGRKHSEETLAKIRANSFNPRARDWEKLYLDWKLTGDIPEIDPKYWLRKVRSYLIRDQGEKCSKCGWNVQHPITGKVPLEIDHLDGDCWNDSYGNIQVLCPNCHSLTPNFRTLNPRGKGYRARNLGTP